MRKRTSTLSFSQKNYISTSNIIQEIFAILKKEKMLYFVRLKKQKVIYYFSRIKKRFIRIRKSCFQYFFSRAALCLLNIKIYKKKQSIYITLFL